MQTRIYKVTCNLEGHTSPRLVDAPSASAAIRHCVSKHYDAKTVTNKELAQLMNDGVKVEFVEVQEKKPYVDPNQTTMAIEP